MNELYLIIMASNIKLKMQMYEIFQEGGGEGDIDHNACSIDVKQRTIDACNVINDVELQNTC